MRALLALLVAALLLSGCGVFGDDADPPPGEGEPRSSEGGAPAGEGGGGGAQSTATPEPPSDRELIDALLARRARALDTGSARRIRRTATLSQYRRDRRGLSAASELRLTRVRYEIRTLEVEGDRARIEAEIAYSVPNVPGRYSLPRKLTAVRDPDDRESWRLTRDRPAERERLPWEVAPLSVQRTVHFVLVHPASVDPGTLPQQLENGYDTMRDAIPGVKLARRYLVVIGADAGQAEKLTNGILGLDTLAAVADSDVREDGDAKQVKDVIAQRLLVVWDNFSPLDAEIRERLVTHELTHLALARNTSGRTPAWLIEGAALLVSGDRRVFEPAAPSLAELSQPRAIGRLVGIEQADAYSRSSGVAFYIDETFGREKFFELYEAFNDEDLRAGSSRSLADKATRRVLGVSLRRLERDSSISLGADEPAGEGDVTPEPTPALEQPDA